MRSQLVLPGESEDKYFSNSFCHRIQQLEDGSYQYHTIDEAKPYWVFCGIFKINVFETFIRLQSLQDPIMAWLLSIRQETPDFNLSNLLILYEWMFAVVGQKCPSAQDVESKLFTLTGYSFDAFRSICMNQTEELMCEYIRYRMQCPPFEELPYEEPSLFDDQVLQTLFANPSFQSSLLSNELNTLKQSFKMNIEEQVDLVKDNPYINKLYLTVLDVIKNGVE